MGRVSKEVRRRAQTGKSVPPMFFTNKTKYRDYYYQFVDQLNSPAYRALSMHARDIYQRIHSHYRAENGKTVSDLPYGELEKAGHTRRHISRWLAELVFFGFIEMKSGDALTCNEYKFSDRWKEIKSDAEAADKKRKWKQIIDNVNDRKAQAKERIKSETE